ncbi:MAG TPA: DUF5074 domain-containing protein [Chryseolinea sp.]|nr:DUF5074 domain-containing protein [Chryseolinea sp.]
MKLSGLKWLTLLAIIFLSCDNNENKPSGKFDDGVFVVNEGNFGTANGTISFISESNGAVTQDLFGSENNGLALGDVVQSMTIHDDLAYIVVNNSNKMEVVQRSTFVSSYTLNGLALPRYFTVLDGKGYVTEWVSFTDPGRVSIVDLDAHAVTGSITTDFGAENIIAYQNLLYVSNTFTNTVSVLDPVAKKVIKTIEVGSAPGSFMIDAQGLIWVICGGNYQSDDGKLVQIDPAKSNDENSESVAKTVELSMNVSTKAVINKGKDKIFFFVGTSVYGVNTTDTAAPSASLFTTAEASSFYGIGIDPETDILYLADAGGFDANGTVYRYSTSGVLVDHVEAGLGPNGFAFE